MASSEETKKRWRVCTWEDHVDRKTEAQRLEEQLNTLSGESYEIYEVDFRKGLIVGRLDLDEEPTAVRGPMDIGSVLREFFAARGRPMPAPSVEPESKEEEEEEEKEFVPTGKLTTPFFEQLNYIISSKLQGDPYTEKRIAGLVKQMFTRAPIDEVQKSLADIEHYHERHREAQKKQGSTCDETCTLSSVFNISEAKLKDHLAANPLS